jgi:hypothetical protein
MTPPAVTPSVTPSVAESRWYARVDDPRLNEITNNYGRWIPTGCTDKEQALDYVTMYYQQTPVIKEWLLL